MLWLVLKTVHVLGATMFFGSGLASAYWKWAGDRSGDPRVVAWCQAQIVRADWLFTAPAGVIMPVTGLWLAHGYGLPWLTGFVGFGMLGWVVTGALWLPAAALQIRMRRDAEAAVRDGTPLPERFRRDNRVWMALGVPAFLLSVFTIWVMTSKWSPF